CGSIIAGEDQDHYPILRVAGMDQSGTESALRYLAERAPYLGRAERGSATLADVERELREVLAGVGAAGEAAGALAALGQIARSLSGRAVLSLDLTVLVAQPADDLDRCLSERMGALTDGAPLSVEVVDRSMRVPVFDEAWQAQ